VDAIAGRPAAQEKLYLIFNTLMQAGKKIVFSGASRPDRLADTQDFLRSRLQWGVTAELHPLDESCMRRMFKTLSEDHGLAVPDNIVNYLFHRIPRDYNSIRDAVQTINRESLAQKKRVSLPLVKSALNLSS
jgi:chromosomal replication initiation ATPase DnaA